MHINQMRKEIAKVYPGPKWKKRVENMPENQVLAVYNSFLKEGRFNKPPVKNPAPQSYYKQLTFDDFIRGPVSK